MAGLNIPHRSELPHGTFLGDLNRARLDAQQKTTDIGNEAVGIGADMVFGEDTGDDMLTDLAYGAVPGGSLYQRAKTGTRPGALDFADFIPGGGAAAKAATMFVPMDLVRSLANRAAYAYTRGIPARILRGASWSAWAAILRRTARSRSRGSRRPW